jgi:hypothetical protein
VVLVGPSTPRAGLEGQRLVESPSDRGVLLGWRVVPSAEAFAAIDAARQRTRAEPREPGRRTPVWGKMGQPVSTRSKPRRGGAFRHGHAACTIDRRSFSR